MGGAWSLACLSENQQPFLVPKQKSSHGSSTIALWLELAASTPQSAGLHTIVVLVPEMKIFLVSMAKSP